ncbi:conserved hypothetical protein [Ricinus communis]|uniref:Uncharacterized protein n=1 Tax=Ricinus communis TaxID=3988 RepID=B9RQW9_RICCO|nr:conserved hypothetical protein [Ricinus communis]
MNYLSHLKTKKAQLKRRWWLVYNHTSINKNHKLELSRARAAIDSPKPVGPVPFSGGLALWWDEEAKIEMGCTLRGYAQETSISSEDKQGGRSPPFSWYNRRAGNKAIWERIDRVVATVDWRLLFPHALVIHESFIGSNQRPIVVDLHHNQRRNKRIFRFEGKWLKNHECNNILKEAWYQPINGSAMYSMAQKLKYCKGALIEWDKAVFRRELARL